MIGLGSQISIFSSHGFVLKRVDSYVSPHWCPHSVVQEVRQTTGAREVVPANIRQIGTTAIGALDNVYADTVIIPPK
jgi:hypothetical protein